jgi:hypothetical protein
MVNLKEPVFVRILFLAWCICAVLPTGAQMRLLPGDVQTGPAIGTQLKPAIAAGGSGYLAAW